MKGEWTYLQWRDATSQYGWKDEAMVQENLEEGPSKCEALGFLAGEDDKSVCLCSQRYDDKMADLLIVPKEAIVVRKVVA